MKFNKGDYVRISTEYADTILQRQTGHIVALPDSEHKDEYLVELDGGITRSPFLEGKVTWIHSNWLETAYKR
jgi:hypothetical protein